MAEQNPFEDAYKDMFDQLGGLLNFIKEKKGSPVDESKIPKDIGERLQKLKKDVEKFNELSKQIVSLSGVPQDEMRKRLDGASTDIPQEGKNLIEKGDNLRHQVNTLKAEISPEEFQGEEKSSKSSFTKEEPVDDKKYTRKRRRKFKRFGSDDSWKPL